MLHWDWSHGRWGNGLCDECLPGGLERGDVKGMKDGGCG